MTYGVGLIGAGPGVAALHAPTLARLGERFRIVHVSDSGSGRAAALAAPWGARSSTGERDLLADPEVEVVAICSPPSEHSRQIREAVRAGVRGILCEKPLALDAVEAAEVIDACREAGVALVVGTNHLFDPAWGRAKHYLDALGAPVRSIAITAVLPPNDRYHAIVSEPTPGEPPVRPRPDWGDRAVAAGILRQLVLGLAVHDLPALRDLAPRIDRVVHARPIPPVGYAIGAIAGDVVIELNAVMVPPGADALWRLAIATGEDRLDVDFPPPFVHDGSARVRVRDGVGRVTEYRRDERDGYLAEWDALADLLDRGQPVEYDQLLDDALYAIAFADAVADAVRAIPPRSHEPLAEASDSDSSRTLDAISRTPVVASDPRWRAAVAELPASLRAADDPDGAIVVVSGARGWGQRAEAAARAGAAAIVVDDPRGDAADQDAAARIEIPLLLHRPGLRADLVGTLPRPESLPALVQAEVGAPADALGSAVADAVGWLRRIAGRPLALRAAGRTRTGVLALLEDDDTALAGTILAAHAEMRWLRASAAGATRTTVEIDRRTSVELVDDRGALVLPAVRESAERAALRRVLDALSDGSQDVGDLADLVADSAVAEEILRADRT